MTARSFDFFLSKYIIFVKVNCQRNFYLLRILFELFCHFLAQEKLTRPCYMCYHSANANMDLADENTLHVCWE